MDHSKTSKHSLPPATVAELVRLGRGARVSVADPDQPELPVLDGAIVLGIGSTGAAADSLIARAAAARAVALVLREPGPDRQASLAADAAAVQLPVFLLPVTEPWDDLLTELTAALHDRGSQTDDDLSQLAQTISVLTGGLVTIEDPDARVLAYSRSSDEVDDLRRRSILGRSGPAEYLQLLRQWGVYERLARPEEVVEVAEHPESGVRRRLAVGVFAGSRQLGTIWLQQGEQPLRPDAARALLGAARVVAAELADRGRSAPSGSGPDAATRAVADLLTGRRAGVPAELGRSGRQPCAVAVLQGGVAGSDRAGERLALVELIRIVSVQAAGFRRDSIAVIADGRGYLYLPALDSPAAAVAPLTEAVLAARRTGCPAARAALGPLVGSAAELARSRRGADRALDRPRSTTPGPPVLTFDELRATLLVDGALDAARRDPEVFSAALAELVTTDRPVADTVLAFLDCGSDAVAAAARLGVHPTTVRYRLKKIAEQRLIDFTDSDERLAAHLQLRSVLQNP